MADAAFTEQYSVNSAAAQRPSGPPTPVSWLMGMVTCALTAGVIYWGVQLAQRDPNSLPVIRAPEGLARLEPTNPGGVQEEFTGLAVNRIQSGDLSEEEIIALAPDLSLLEEEDVPALLDLEGEEITPTRVDINELNGEQVVEVPDLAPMTTRVDDETGAEIMMPVTAEEVETALAEALKLASTMMEGEETAASGEAAAVASDATSEEEDLAALIFEDVISQLSAAESAEEGAAEAVAEEAATEDQAEVTEVAADVPETTTEDDATEVANATPTETATEGEEVASVEAGTALIQLGAFGSRNVARTMWETLQSRNTELLSGRSYFIQPVETGGKTLFRLRVLGFANSDEARSMCAALAERKTPCLAVIQR